MLNNNPISIIGCGYIGKLLAQQLQHKNIDTLSYVNSESSQTECQKLNIACHTLDLDKPQQPIDLRNNHVIYLVPPVKSGRTDTRITNFINAIENSPPEKIVLISTTGVYGDCNGEWIDETRTLKPKADRAFRRADAERQLQQFCNKKSIPLVILRVTGIYGPGKIPIARIKSGQPIVNQQDSPFTNRIHAYDLVSICEKALLNKDISGIYNVSDGHPGTMFEYFTAVAKAMNLKEPPAISLAEAQKQLSKGMLSYMAESRRISNEKLLNDFDIKLRYPTLNDGIKHLSETIKLN